MVEDERGNFESIAHRKTSDSEARYALENGAAVTCMNQMYKQDRNHHAPLVQTLSR